MPDLFNVDKNHVTFQLLLQWTRIKKKKNSVYESDIPVTLKKVKVTKTWYELVDPKQGYGNAKFEKPHFNSVHEKGND